MNTKITTFKELIVWQKAMQLARDVYAYTLQLPREELYALSSQMRRAAVSIPSNIAEGKKWKTRADFVHFLRMSHGSVAELETQLILAQDLYGETLCRCVPRWMKSGACWVL